MTGRFIKVLTVLVFTLSAGGAQASLIGDVFDYEISLGGGIEFLGGGQTIVGSDTVDGSVNRNFCVIAAGSSQNCGFSGISGSIALFDSAIELVMAGSTGAGGSITWSFTDLDWVGVSGAIVGVDPPADPRGIVVDGFTADSVTLSTTNTNFVGNPQRFRFELQTRHVAAPGSMLLLSAGLFGLAAMTRRRRARASSG